MALILAGFAALFYGVADFSGGLAARRSPVLPVVLFSQLLGISVAIAALALRWPGLPPLRDLLWGFLAGSFGTLGLFMLYGGIGRSIVAIVSPTSAVAGAMLPLVFAVCLGERPSAMDLTGCALCLAAVLLLSRESDGEAHDRRATRTALGYGALAGLGFGVVFTAISRTGAGSGLWPLVAARVASIAATVVIMGIRRQPLRVRPGDMAPALAAGAADMGGNILFLLASQSGLLSLVVILASLSPAPTVLLARLFLAQRLSWARWTGLVLALAGVGLISAR
jgi:drug/metabolite transporter (DMT)-like permease